MSIHQACTFYNVSKTVLQCWLKTPSIKQTRNKPPTKIPDETLLKDVKQHPDDYIYDRAQRFGCSKPGIEAALKRLALASVKKKTLEYPKSCP